MCVWLFVFMCQSCMRQGMLTLSGAPCTISHLYINILTILHHLGSPLG